MRCEMLLGLNAAAGRWLPLKTCSSIDGGTFCLHRFFSTPTSQQSESDRNVNEQSITDIKGMVSNGKNTNKLVSWLPASLCVWFFYSNLSVQFSSVSAGKCLNWTWFSVPLMLSHLFDGCAAWGVLLVMNGKRRTYSVQCFQALWCFHLLLSKTA